MSKLWDENRPDPDIINDRAAMRDLLSLVTQEWVIDDELEELSPPERYHLMHWAMVAHFTASTDNPPIPAPAPPIFLKKVVIRPGRELVIDGMGATCVALSYTDNHKSLYIKAGQDSVLVSQEDIIAVNEVPLYPTLKRMREVKEESQAIGHFIEWLSVDKDIVLCVPLARREVEYIPTTYSIEQILAQFFNIDLDEAEREKCCIIDVQIALNHMDSA